MKISLNFSKIKQFKEIVKTNKKLWILAVFPVLLLVVFLVNFLSLQTKMNSVIDADTRNEGIKVSVHYQYYLNPDKLIYDLEKVPLTKSRADVFRVFLQFADAVQDKEFNDVELAYKGKTKFILDGDDFKTIGEEYSWQNAVYTMRTFPEKLHNPYGLEAFPTWEGGILGVTNQQMEDFSKFHDEWYFDEL